MLFRSAVAGVDGCRGGWVVAVVDSGGLASLDVVPTLAEVIAREDLAVIAVDIPIGLPSSDGTRQCDVEARQALRPFGSRVFPAPVRESLTHLDDYAAACAASRAVCGNAMSRQAWNILGKIAEADAIALDPRVYECHPEVSFAALAGAPVAQRKKTREGREIRLSLLREWLPGIGDPGFGDDGLDALACAWTASRILAGCARPLPDGPTPRDAADRPMRICT